MSQSDLTEILEAETLAQDPAEERVTQRLQDYWNTLRGGQQFPSRANFRMEAVTGLGPNAFALDLAHGADDPVFRFIGTALTDDCGKDFTLKPLSEVPPHTLLAEVARRLYRRRRPEDAGRIRRRTRRRRRLHGPVPGRHAAVQRRRANPRFHRRRNHLQEKVVRDNFGRGARRGSCRGHRPGGRGRHRGTIGRGRCERVGATVTKPRGVPGPGARGGAGGFEIARDPVSRPRERLCLLLRVRGRSRGLCGIAHRRRNRSADAGAIHPDRQTRLRR